jgi:hypothetical protein
MKNWINGFGTCFALFVGIGFCMWCWWLYPHQLDTPSSNMKMKTMVAFYSIDERLTVDMIEGVMR